MPYLLNGNFDDPQQGGGYENKKNRAPNGDEPVTFQGHEIINNRFNLSGGFVPKGRPDHAEELMIDPVGAGIQAKKAYQDNEDGTE